jgi:hypothetical protein
MDRFFFRKEKIGYIVYDKISEEVFLVNKSGKKILEYISKGFSEKQIVNELIKKYNISLNKLKNDIKTFLRIFKTYIK